VIDGGATNMPQSIDSTRLGGNRTGLKTSPLLGKEMTENAEAPDLTSADPDALASVRREYILEADPLGSVPPPATVKGAAKSGVQMIAGKRPQAFLDKLAERLAFERGGARLYDAVLAKLATHAAELRGPVAADVERIRDDEVRHALLVKACIEELGADPTAQTPCADLVGVETSGFLQAASDPRTTLAQTLHAALAAELVDGAGWETLIALAENMGQDEMAEQFRGALQQETQHLAMVRRWFHELTLETATVT
jgi:rubrerythrin